MHNSSAVTDPFNGRSMEVTPERAVNVINHGHPPKSETLFAIPFRQRVKDSGGVSDMNIDGSVTNVDYTVDAIQGRDIYIRSLSVEIGDTGSPALNKFGALSELANGVELCYVTQDQGSFVIHDGIKTNLEFIRLGVDTYSIGTGADSFLADVSGGGTTKSYLPIIDIQETFGLPFGLKLREATKDKFNVKIKDNLTGLTEFNIIAYGIQI